MNGCILIRAAELIRMIDPPRAPSMILCAPAITVFHTPVTLTSMTSRKSPGVMAHTVIDRLAESLEILGCRGVVSNTRRLACDVDGDDVGALAGHPNCMRAALTTSRTG